MEFLADQEYPLLGGSGKVHTFKALTMDSSFKEIGGIYIFVSRSTGKGPYKEVFTFMDKADNISTEVTSLYKSNAFKPNPIKLVLIKYIHSEEERDEILKDTLSADYDTLFYKDYC